MAGHGVPRERSADVIALRTSAYRKRDDDRVAQLRARCAIVSSVASGNASASTG
jgi:hypothetical protein